ncbi:asparaginase domain-containing protein [Halohasta salina]|uniref:asparaginase domain-containing protein n=1 Tax=Halohasta salina TaxID=2961621 RepID=UPI0020A5DC66|nr:asparaginase domain-containing protein [Halohasta salina]
MDDTYIHFLTTGGTIDKEYRTRRGTRNLTVGPPAVERILDTIVPEPTFEYAVETVCKKDSLDVDADDRAQVAAACREAPGEQVVITHGTDTMTETAAALDGDKTVVLTGAATPQRMVDSDAAFNVGTAIGAVQTLDSGVYIAMGGGVYPHDAVEKRDDGQFAPK